MNEWKIKPKGFIFYVFMAGNGSINKYKATYLTQSCLTPN